MRVRVRGWGARAGVRAGVGARVRVRVRVSVTSRRGASSRPPSAALRREAVQLARRRTWLGVGPGLG